MSRAIWRITKAKYAETALSGWGAMLHAGRWHTKGYPMIYCADSPAPALLETMVHVEHQDLLHFDMVAIRVEVQDTLLATLLETDLPASWQDWPWPAATQRIGTQWFLRQESVVLQVPSAVVPLQFNYLINPLHPQFDMLSIDSPQPFPIDLGRVDH